MSKLSGLNAWILQRLTAIYMAVYICFALISLAINGLPDGADQWQALVGQGWFNLALLVFVLALIYHAWVGIRDVIVDYIHPVWIRFTVLTVFASGLLVCAVWSARILFNALQ
ncbi:MAG: succinate dehydrogenase, hydrophobic membrane anchor protein [Gammaproteobacteria bacterium]